MSAATSCALRVALLVLHQEADRLGREIHVVAGVADRLGRHLGDRAVLLDLLGDVAHQRGERGIGALVDLVLGDIVRDGRPRIAENVVARRLGADHRAAACEFAANCAIWLAGMARLSA